MNKCFKCRKDFADDKSCFKCDGCMRLLHITCANVTSTEVRCLELSTKSRKLKFFCDECESSFLQVPTLIKLIEDLRSEVRDLKTSYEDNLKAKDQEVEELRKELKKMEIQNNSKLPPEDWFIEIRDRMSKANNLMIYNVPESSSKNIQDRIEHDSSHLTEILTTLEKNNSASDVVKLVRVGKPDPSKLRPIKVIFSNCEVVKDIMKNKNNLSNGPFKISYDQTKMQRDIFKNVLNTLKSRQESGESDLIIRYRNGTPTIEMKKKN